MALQDSYDSKINRLVKTPAIILDIKKSVLLSPLKQYSNDVLYITEEQTVVPLFIHPLYDRESDKVYIDVRPFTTIERDGSLKIRNEYDHELAIIRANLELVWQRANQNDVFAAFDFPNQIYTRWLAETISHRYGLAPLQQVKVLALVAMFNIGQYFNTVEDELSINRHLQMISRNFMVDATLIVDVATQLENHFPRDVDEFVAAIQRLDISPRLKDFTTLALFNMLGGSWFLTSNQLQVVGLALEYPPCFAALVYMATQYSAFKRTGIGQRVDKANRHNAHGVFTRQVVGLIDSCTEE